VSEQTWWPAAARTRTVGVLVEAGPRGGGRYLVTVDRELLLGRDDACPVVFLSDRVSRRHARLLPMGGDRYAVEDLRSLNGTYVNGARVVGSRELFDGDRLRLGDVELAFRVRAAGADLPAAPRRPPAAHEGAPRGATVAMPPPGAPADAPGEVAGDGGRPGARSRKGSVIMLMVLAVVVAGVGMTAANALFGRAVFPLPFRDTAVTAAQRLPAGCAARPTMSLQPAGGRKGVSVSVRGTCFQPAERVRVSLGGKVLTTATADGQGSLTARVRLDAAAACPADRCELVLEGTQSARRQSATYAAKAA
jgi:pSer/pThr/pTyr-binding forkhead associated (FHA) protein